MARPDAPKRPAEAPKRHHRAPAAHRPARQPATPARLPRPRYFYDSLTPGAIPPHRVVATYATGPRAVPPAAVAGRRNVIWIDSQGTDPGADALDVEPGDATPPVAAAWVRRKLAADPGGLAILYCNMSWWPAVKAAVAGLPARMQARVRWWIADPTGSPHLVPGSDATQWYWGNSYDISLATPRF